METIPQSAGAAPIKARILSACVYGAAGTVAEVPADEVLAAQAAGVIDTSAAAVAYVTQMTTRQLATAKAEPAGQGDAAAPGTTPDADQPGFLVLAPLATSTN